MDTLSNLRLALHTFSTQQSQLPSFDVTQRSARMVIDETDIVLQISFSFLLNGKNRTKRICITNMDLVCLDHSVNSYNNYIWKTVKESLYAEVSDFIFNQKYSTDSKREKKKLITNKATFTFLMDFVRTQRNQDYTRRGIFTITEDEPPTVFLGLELELKNNSDALNGIEIKLR